MSRRMAQTPSETAHPASSERPPAPAAPFAFRQLDAAGGAPAPIAIAAAAEPEVLQAVRAAADRGIVSPILCADPDELQSAADAAGVDLAGMDVRSVTGAEDAARTAVALVATGEASILMKGLVDTSVLLHAVLDRSAGLRGGSVLSHLAVFEIDGFPRPLGITDATMNIAPGVETKLAIVRNAVAFFRSIGYREPRVAMLAAKERVSERMSATTDAAAVVEAYHRGELPGCVVDGPFALDNAVSTTAAAIKGIDSPVAGAADILVVPQIESGNVLYKALAFLTRSRHAGVIVGARAPIVLTSRADSHQAKLDSIALAAWSRRRAE